MIFYYSIINRLLEEYFNSQGFTKESKLLTAYYLICLLDEEKNPENIKNFNEINKMLNLAIHNHKIGSYKLSDYYLKLASKRNEKNITVITNKLGELDPSMREAMVSNVNFDFKKGFIGVVEEW